MLTKDIIALELQSMVSEIIPGAEFPPTPKFNLEDTIAYLRTMTVYQNFDLEATRRERDYYMRRLSEDE